MVGRIQYAPTTGYVRSFEIPMRSPNWVRARVQKMDLYTPPSVAYSGAYAIRPYNRVRAALRKTVPFSSPSGPSVGRIRYAPTTGYVRPFEKLSRFRPLRGRGVGVFNTPLQPDTCGPSKNCPVFVPFGAACGAYAIRPYDRIRAILRNTDEILQPGTCEGSKNGSVYATVGGVWWSVCNTPLQSGTCDPSKYRYNSSTRYVLPFKKTVPFLSSSGPLMGRIQYASTTGHVRSYEILI